MKMLSNYLRCYKGFGCHCEMKIVSRHVPKLRNSTYVAYVLCSSVWSKVSHSLKAIKNDPGSYLLAITQKLSIVRPQSIFLNSILWLDTIKVFLHSNFFTVPDLWQKTFRILITYFFQFQLQPKLEFKVLLKFRYCEKATKLKYISHLLKKNT